ARSAAPRYAGLRPGVARPGLRPTGPDAAGTASASLPDHRLRRGLALAGRADRTPPAAPPRRRHHRPAAPAAATQPRPDAHQLGPAGCPARPTAPTPGSTDHPPAPGRQSSSGVRATAKTGTTPQGAAAAAGPRARHTPPPTRPCAPPTANQTQGQPTARLGVPAARVPPGARQTRWRP